MACITLTTDFGSSDWFVGAMKGVLLSHAPQAQIVDISHTVPPGDLRHAAFALAVSCRSFPKRTTHVAVVDPGVGSERPAIAVQTEDFLFLGPDNGVLSYALAHERIRAIRRLDNAALFRNPVSRTFHGRDIFAPVAGHLAAGLPFSKVGPKQSDYTRIPWPVPRLTSQSIRGQVIYLDHFGNAITNIAEESLAPLEGRPSRILVGRRSVGALRRFYQEVPRGRAIGLRGSSGFLEIAVNGGSAAKKFRLKPGAPVTVRLE